MKIFWVGVWRTALLLFRFDHFFQRKLERRVAQGLTEIIQRVPRRFAKFAGGGYGSVVVEGNLHLDVDSANLATHVSQQNNKFRRKLTQFCGNGSVADGDGERA